MACSKRLVRNTSLPLQANKPSKEGPKPNNCKSVNSTPVHYDELTIAKPLSTLQLIEEINDIQLKDLNINCGKEYKCLAVTFDENERLYSNLIDLEENAKCSKRNTKPVINSLKKDPIPTLKDIGICCSGIEYSFCRQRLSSHVKKGSLVGAKSNVGKLWKCMANSSQLKR